ncbi:MAG: transcriptional regulator [Gammaproteobacteria bacterium]|nr:transcriptional regulator [Gammaproteobacteria bacterium]
MFHQLPETGYLREWQILGDAQNHIPPLIPVSKATWRRGCKTGRFPAPLKNGRINIWPVESIRALIANGMKHGG